MPSQLLNSRSINSRGVDLCKAQHLFDVASAYDFCLIQETHVLSDKCIKFLSSKWPGPSFWSPAIGRQRGAALLINVKCSVEVLSWKKDASGRVVSLLINANRVKLNLVCIYAPTSLSEKKAFLKVFMST